MASYPTLPIPQQVQSNIIANYQQGESNRAAAEEAKKQSNREERKLKLEEDKWNTLKNSTEGESASAVFTAAVTGYDNALADGRSEQEANAAGWDAMIFAADQITPGDASVAEGELNKKGITKENFSAKQFKNFLGIGPDKKKDAALQHVPFIGDDGQAHVGAFNPDSGQYTDSSGKTHINASPIAPTASQEDLMTPSQRGAMYKEHTDSFNDSSDVQELITDALPQVSDLPGAVGARGKFASLGAGLLSTLGQDEMAGAFSEAVSGASQEEITALQTQLQVIRSRIIPITTGEASARISDNERDIANRTVGIIDSIKGPADLTKAYPQVIGAMKQLYVESWANKYRIASRDNDIQYPYDLNIPSEQEELIDEFVNAGIDEQTIRNALTRLARVQGALP